MNSRKIIVFLIVAAMILFIGSKFMPNASALVNKSTAASASPVTTGESTITVKIPIGAYEIKDSNNGQGEKTISINDFGMLFVPGKPNLPSRIFPIAIPPGAEFTGITFDLGQGVLLPGAYKISPVGLPRAIDEENPLIYQKDKKTYEENYNTAYGSDTPYPTSVVEFVRTAGYRKYNLVDVRVTPFTYLPKSGQLTYYPQITVNIKYTMPKGFTSDKIMVDNLPSAEKNAEEFILNYKQSQDWYQNAPKPIGPTENYDFVIITLDSLNSSITPLVNWEITKGRSVKVVTTSWINSSYTGYDLAEKMRNFLRDKYPTSAWGIKDVLMVGNHVDVPMRRTWQDEGYGKPETDFYYAELSKPDNQSWDSNGNHRWGENSDTMDFYNEVNVGRIPWSTPADVLHISNKSVAYEQNNDPSFKKNILLLGAFFWDDTDSAVLMDLKVNQPWMTTWTKTRMFEQGHSSHPMNFTLNYNNVRTNWSASKYAFVDWAGHGSEYGAYILYSTGEAFVSTSTSPSLNDNYPAIIFADSCSNADTDYNTSLAATMIKRGAVGFVGATKVAYGQPGWNNPNSGSSQSFDYYFTTRVTQGNYTQGDAHQWALRYMYDHGLWGSSTVRYEMFEWGALWGNPDLRMGIVNNPPQTPATPAGISEGEPEILYNFTTSTIDPEGDNVYYWFDWGDGGNSGWIGPYNSGDTATSSKFWLRGAYSIKVKAKDLYNHETGWSNSATVAIYTCGDASGDSAVDVGDVVYLINYLYKNGPAPNPLQSGDVNKDGITDIGDVVYLINFLYKTGPAPCSGKESIMPAEMPKTYEEAMDFLSNAQNNAAS